jgi:cell division protein FtsI/penicillin-binding protein 2
MSEHNTHTNDINGRQRAKATKRDIIARVKSLYGILFLSALAVTVRLVWIIIFSPSVIHNANVMDEGIYRTSTIKAHRGTILSREHIMRHVWSDEVVVLDRTIDVNITRMRKKLGEYGSYIITRTGYGYGFKV